ncbi:MAG: DUF1064 domain-containing protein [Lachnospiraceae bacterium]|nr:DUF1064 domain-containing protein [Lachnospiraceae bacterium]
MSWNNYGKKNKYGNNPVTVDGIRYDSSNEARRHAFLKIMEQAGNISNLRYHVNFELIPAITKEEVVHLKTKDKIVTKTVQTARYYEADFVYTVTKTGEEVVEDFKGQETDLFKFKAALFFYIYKKPIRIVKQVNEDVN